MTSTDKPVQRVTREAYSVLRAGPGRARRIVIRIDRGDLLRFRPQRGRTWFALPAELAFRLAVERTAAQARANHVPHSLDDR